MDRRNKHFKIALAILCLSLLLFLLVLVNLPDDNLHLVFCDVGQGDAILVSYKNNQVLIDGGLSKNSGKLLSCLSSQMPFWDRTIEVVINTHPDEDHFGGLIEVVKRYRINKFLHSGADNLDSWKFKEFKKALIDKKVCSKIMAESDAFRINKVQFVSIFPFVNKPQVESDLHLTFFDKNKKCPMPIFKKTTDSLNDSSIVLHLKFGEFDALLTGDIDQKIEQILVWRKKIDLVEVLKIAHHGSKHSTSIDLLKATQPQLAVISVGKNSYGHPTKEVLDRLDAFEIDYLRTDVDGTIRVVSDGRKWWMK